MAREYKDVVVGLDIGTAKVMAVVAEVLPGGELKLAGLGVAPSNGLKRGVVVNIDATCTLACRRARGPGERVAAVVSVAGADGVV